MVGRSSASDVQKYAVRSMIEKMKRPEKKPSNMSFTMGWDVVASYSEEQINKLLADRYRKGSSAILQEVSFDTKGYDEENERSYTVTYNVKFGPPLLEFDRTATAKPECSLKMEMISATRTIGKKVKTYEPGWSIKLNNIPLASARGIMSEGGTISGNPELIPGTQPIHFDNNQEQEQHVVLGFEMNKSKLVVEAIPPPGWNPEEEGHAATQEGFQKRFKEYFAGREEKPPQPGQAPGEPQPKETPRSLSYSIASVNNKSNNEAVDLTPEKFQFATYYGEGNYKHIRLISIFIQVKGGPKSGRTEALQELWKAQWYENNILPIPEGFSASLILSSALLNQVILKQGFEKSKWTIKDTTSADDTLVNLECRSQETWKIPEQNYPWGPTNIFHVDGFEFKLQDYPMKLTIEQQDCGDVPAVCAYWDMEKRIHWENTYKLLGLGGRVTSSQGYVTPRYRLCGAEENSRHLPRKLESKFIVNDEKFDIDLCLKTESFRMDQPEENGLAGEFDTWQKGMRGLWTQAPNVKITAFGIHFLRTTNLLLPGQNVIDINEEIGVRIPKDLVLVGDVEKAA